jgi:hypothetical protein
MSGAGKVKYLKVCVSGVLIGLMSIRLAFAGYNVTAKTALSMVRINAITQVNTGLIATFSINASTVQGEVYCGAGDLHSDLAWHYVLIDLPRDPDNVGYYRINDNLSVSGMAMRTPVGTWLNISSGVCSNYGGIQPSFQPANTLTNAFPITLDFYVKKRPIDNLITFPQMPLGGYIRSFGGPSGVISKTYAIPIFLAGGAIQLPSTCTANPTALTLDHGTVSAGSTFHRTSSTITYTCDSPVKATFSLAYEADGNGALPLKDSAGKTGAVSKLTISDPQTGAVGRRIEASIQTSKTFMVSSELSNITGNGQLTGSAWLIAIQD